MAIALVALGWLESENCWGGEAGPVVLLGFRNPNLYAASRFFLFR